MEAAAIAQAVGSVAQPGGLVVHGLIIEVQRTYANVKNLGKNFRSLKDEMQRLCVHERDVNEVIIRNEVLMEKTHLCTAWLDDVRKMRADFVDLERRYNIVRRKSWRHWSNKEKFSKDVISKKQLVVELRNRIDLNNVVMNKRPAKVIIKHGKKIYDVPSQYENVEILLRHLQDKSIRTIGIWGAAGVGKTTILRRLQDEIEKTTNVFDIVIWVDVPKNGSTSKILEVIAKRLKLKVGDINVNNDEQVSDMIYTVLKGKNYLLLLDEVFPKTSPWDLGVHDTLDNGKMVVATRDRPDLFRIDVDEEVNVKRLSKPDAWEMFKTIVGDATDRPGITPIARKVLHQCGELPQIINVVGKTLKNVYNESLWRDKLNELQSPSGSILQDMEEAYKAFKLAYHKLTDDMKDCLLYGALFPEDHDIYQDYLIECWKAEYFIRVSSLMMARIRGHGILHELINTTLLERGKTIEYVKMPIIFKNMALRMIHLNNAVLVRSGEDITTLPPQDEWMSARRISLMCNEFPTLPDMPECSTISTLLLQRNGALKTIPSTFFAYMSCLRVLDLYKTKIKLLPMSISNLKELRSLYLNHCIHIVELPAWIGELSRLEVLDIRGTGIHTMPTIIQELVSLACLRVSFAKDVDAQQRIMIPCHIIGRLHQLEELTIDVDTNEQRWDMIVNDIANEVATLRTLSTLNFYFPDKTCFEGFMRNMESENSNRCIRSLGSFRLLVGDDATRHINNRHVSKTINERYFRYSGGEDFTAAMLKVLERVITFELIGHHIQSLSNFGTDRLKGLQVCIIKDCNMESIVNVSTTMCVAFPYLEQLHVIGVPNLERILKGMPESGSFAELTTLQLCGCPMMITIFPVGVTQHLAKLQALRVDNCSLVEHIIETDDLSVGLPELKILELTNLPQLVRIYPTASLSWPTLAKVEIISCDLLKNLPFSKENASKLRRIKCHEVWWTNLVWDCPIVKDSLRNTCSFI